MVVGIFGEIADSCRYWTFVDVAFLMQIESEM